MKNILFYTLLLISLWVNTLSLEQLYGQVIFQKIIQNSYSTMGYTIELTDDGGFLVAGQSENSILGGKDILVSKYNAEGIIEWTKIYGGNGDDLARTVINTSDHGIAILGSTTSFGFGDEDIFLIKTDASGNVQWSKTYGDAKQDRGFTIKQTGDNGYILGGSTLPLGNTQNADAYLIKTNSSGDILWTRTIGGSGHDNCFNINLTNDNGYIFTGTESSFGTGNFSFLLAKLSGDGIIEWSKAIGGWYEDHSRIVLNTQDNGFIILSHTLSFGSGSWDVLIVKTDFTGNIEWAKVYGGTGKDYIGSMVATYDSGFAFCGITNSYGSGSGDLFINKIDHEGNLLWAKTYGGPGIEDISFGGNNSIVQTPDSGFMLTGQSNSFSSGMAIYIVKTDQDGVSGCNETDYLPNVETVFPQLNNSTTLFGEINHSSDANTLAYTIVVNDSTLCPVDNLVAGFNVSDTVLCAGQCIDYLDMSVPEPISWSWYFEGATPSQSNVRNPENICYDTPGNYLVKLVVSLDINVCCVQRFVIINHFFTHESLLPPQVGPL